MKRLVLAAVLLAAAGLARADSAVSGADVYAKKCAVCHGKDGKGSPAGLKMGANDLNGIALSKDEIQNVVENGKGKMAAFKGKLSHEEIEAVAKYVKAGLK